MSTKRYMLDVMCSRLQTGLHHVRVDLDGACLIQVSVYPSSESIGTLVTAVRAALEATLRDAIMEGLDLEGDTFQRGGYR